MLAIRLQRRGRNNQAQYRIVVQDSRHHPTSGRVVEYLGSYDPHSKKIVIESEKIQTYLKNGAQPSDRMARLLKAQKIKLPAWVELKKQPKKALKNPQKLRKNQPKESPAKDESVATIEPVAEEVDVTTEKDQEVSEKSEDISEDIAVETEVVQEADDASVPTKDLEA